MRKEVMLATPNLEIDFTGLAYLHTCGQLTSLPLKAFKSRPAKNYGRYCSDNK